MERTIRKPGAGFTLIELMLVASIIGFIAAIAVPKFANLINKAWEARAKGNLGAVRSALSLYYADNEGFYPGWHSTRYGPLIFLNGKYIEEVPRIHFKGNGFFHPRIVVFGFDHSSYWNAGVVNWDAAANELTLTVPLNSEVNPGRTDYRYDVGTPPIVVSPPFMSARIFLNCYHLDSRGQAWSSW